MPVSERAVRSRLVRKGYALHKNRSRSTEDPFFGGYYISDPYTNTVIDGFHPCLYSLDLSEADQRSRDLDRNWRM